MNSNSKPQSNAETIYQSLEELHMLLSVLEQQVQSGLFLAQLETRTDEIATPKAHHHTPDWKTIH